MKIICWLFGHKWRDEKEFASCARSGHGYGMAASTGLHTPHVELEPAPPRDG